MKFEPNSEMNPSRIHSSLKNSATGAITAFSKEFNYNENQQRNRSLLAKLMDKGYGVTSIDGSYIEHYGSDEANEVKEHSFFVAGKSEGDDQGELEKYLIQLGKEFDQDSILSIPFGGEACIIGTSDREGAWPGLGVIKPQDSFKHGKAGEFLSKVHNRTFKFEDIEPFQTNNGRWGNSMLAKTHWRDIVL
ncbi:MAG TPA: hypothetical protein VN247_05250 [Arenimonas sp.]|nr:hypothetical protein [Arenimonas sp.]